MKIEEYTKIALLTMTKGHRYGEIDPVLMAGVLGLVGEGGEVAEKFKKILREKKGIISEEDRLEILKELGDVLWYITTVSSQLDSSLEEVARMNNEKLMSRKERDVVSGQGDNR